MGGGGVWSALSVTCVCKPWDAMGAELWFCEYTLGVLEAGEREVGVVGVILIKVTYKLKLTGA